MTKKCIICKEPVYRLNAKTCSLVCGKVREKQLIEKRKIAKERG